MSTNPNTNIGEFYLSFIQYHRCSKIFHPRKQETSYMRKSGVILHYWNWAIPAFRNSLPVWFLNTKLHRLYPTSYLL